MFVYILKRILLMVPTLLGALTITFVVMQFVPGGPVEQLSRGRQGVLYPTRDAMRAALEQHLPKGCRWTTPVGGMFFWVELPEGVDATALLPKAVAQGMAYVPGAAFFADHAKANTLRLSFVTVPPADIERGIALLAKTLKENA